MNTSQEENESSIVAWYDTVRSQWRWECGPCNEEHAKTAALRRALIIYCANARTRRCDRLRRAARLAGVTFALPGTLADRMTRCGYPGCRCHADPPQLHGPYHQWTRKKNGRTATRILSDDQLADYGPWFDNHRRLRP